MASAEAPKAKKTSAYFSFCKHHREQLKARLKEAGKPISAPALTKALSELWRSLSDLEKQKYKDLSPSSCPDLYLNPLPPPSSGGGELDDLSRDQTCGEKSRVKESAEEIGIEGREAEIFLKENVATEPAATSVGKVCTVMDADFCKGQVRPSEEEGACIEEALVKAQDEGSTENEGLAFPLARVKRIIKLDKEIRVVAADASSLIAYASQHFLEHLTVAAHASALKKKHKTIRLEDVKNAVKSEPRIDDFLAEALNDVLHCGKEDYLESSDDADDAPEIVQREKGHANKRSKSTKKPMPELPAGTRRIADFFTNTNQVKVSNLDVA
eukprot:c13583_g1_i1 orf=184-1164(-)